MLVPSDSSSNTNTTCTDNSKSKSNRKLRSCSLEPGFKLEFLRTSRGYWVLLSICKKEPLLF